FPSVGVLVARDDRFALAVKAGDNGDSHNHNDTGSITLYKDGRPVLIDVGVESYTQKTFSPRRYEIWTMQSAYHNLPTFAGVMQ
ncbi:heparinase II/III family protein, partial [Mycobacterium tuberculosis]|nr:heparinase II/III family protein [Mycobacterium tuberculosis]